MLNEYSLKLMLLENQLSLPKESSFLAAQSFGLLHVWALSVQMSFTQMK